MTQLEQVKAEIERLKHYGTIPYGRDVFEGVCLIESFINSLPAEEASGDLEEEISNYIKENFFGSDSMGLLSNRTNGELDCIDVVNIARYFANWQKEQLIKNVVETKVQGRIDGKGIFIDTDIPIGIDVNEDDKVKIIIIKEAE